MRNADRYQMGMQIAGTPQTVDVNDLLSQQRQEIYVDIPLTSFKRRLFDCFDIGLDQTTTIDSEKILKLFGKEAYDYLTDIWKEKENGN